MRYEFIIHETTEGHTSWYEVGHWKTDQWVSVCNTLWPHQAKALVAHLNNGKPFKEWAEKEWPSP
jgi:hypothetical protein